MRNVARDPFEERPQAERSGFAVPADSLEVGFGDSSQNGRHLLANAVDQAQLGFEIAGVISQLGRELVRIATKSVGSF